jgi:hypothetical protein
MFWTILLLLIAALAGGFYWYVYFVRKQEEVKSAFSNTCWAFGRYHEMVADLLVLGKRLMPLTEPQMQELTKMRAQVEEARNMRDARLQMQYMVMENQFQMKVKHFLAFLGNLQDAGIVKAHEASKEADKAINEGRHRYNGSARTYNNILENLPAVALIDLFKLDWRPYPFWPVQ